MIRLTFVIVFTLQFLTACATGKSITKADKIADTGSSNIVAFTYDLIVHATDKYPTVKSTILNFRCPKNDDLQSLCFAASLPYIGLETTGGYAAHEFRAAGSKALSMPYGEYALTSADHRVTVNKKPKTTCYYSKKKKRDVCSTRDVDEKVKHRAEFIEPVAFAVASGSGCYLGHLNLVMLNGNIDVFDFQRGSALTPDKLEMFTEDLRDPVSAHVTGVC